MSEWKVIKFLGKVLVVKEISNGVKCLAQNQRNQMIQVPPAPIYSISSRLTSAYWAKVNKFGTEEEWNNKISEYSTAHEIENFVPSTIRLWAAKPGAVVLIVIAAVESAVYWVFRNAKKLESSTFAIQWNWKTITGLTSEKYQVPTQEIFARNWVDSSYVRTEDLFAVNRCTVNEQFAIMIYCTTGSFNKHHHFKEGIEAFLGNDSIPAALPNDPDFRTEFSKATDLHSDAMQFVLTRIVWNMILDHSSSYNIHADSGIEISRLNGVFYGHKKVQANEKLQPDWHTKLSQEEAITARGSVQQYQAIGIEGLLSNDPRSLPCFNNPANFKHWKNHELIQHILQPIVDREIRETTPLVTWCLARAQEIVREQLREKQPTPIH